VDCHLFTTGAGGRAGIHFLAVCVASVTMLAILLAPVVCAAGARDHLFCLLQGCCVFCFNFWCFYTAAAHINTGLESVIFSMAVLFNAINSFIFFRQQPPGRFWRRRARPCRDRHAVLGRPAQPTGSTPPAVGDWSQRWEPTVFRSAICSIRHQRRGLETLTTNSWAMLYGTLVMGAIALVRGDNFMPQWTLSYMGALLYLALFGSVIAFGAYLRWLGASAPAKPPTVPCCFRWWP
jgi:drug/metabolite transporter (DMT)-like permease